MAATQKVNTTASNIANVTTSGSLDDDGQAPYSALTTQRTAVRGEDGSPQGVRSEAVPKNTPFVPSFDPDSPFADENGFIGVPNVDLAEEAVNLSVAELEFKANAKIITTAEDMADELLRVFDEEV